MPLPVTGLWGPHKVTAGRLWPPVMLLSLSATGEGRGPLGRMAGPAGPVPKLIAWGAVRLCLLMVPTVYPHKVAHSLPTCQHRSSMALSPWGFLQCPSLRARGWSLEMRSTVRPASSAGCGVMFHVKRGALYAAGGLALILPTIFAANAGLFRPALRRPGHGNALPTRQPAGARQSARTPRA